MLLVLNNLNVSWPDLDSEEVYPGLKRRFNWTAIQIFVLFFFIAPFGIQNLSIAIKIWRLFIVVVLIQIFIEYFLPLITQRKIEGYINKLRAQDKIDSGVSTLYDKIRPFYLIYALIGLALVVFLAIVMNAGYAHALNQDDFIIIKNPDSKVILRTYSDKLIVSPIGPNNQLVEREFQIIEITENQNLIFRSKDIGPLAYPTSTPTVTPTPRPTNTFTPSPTAIQTPTKQP